MAQFTALETVTEFRRSTARAAAVSRLEALFLGDAPTLRVLVLAGVPTVAALWLLLAPERLLSRAMTWDLLFNLSGAWRIQNGHVPHVDFHDPLGPLSFWLTNLGFSIDGPGPHAFLAGQAIFVAFAFGTALVVASRRLATAPATLFVLYASLLILMPVNLGSQPNAYTFAMSYNRWGWSTLTTLCLLLFLPPRRRQGAWIDPIVAGLLLIAMFYLKITFAVAGGAAVVLALLVSNHVRERWRIWLIVVTLLLLNVAAPYSHPYVADILEASNGGYGRPVLDHIRIALASKAEFALYGGSVLLLFWLWRHGRAPWQYILFAAVIPCLGMFVISQSNQEGSIPLGTVIAYLMCDALRGDRQLAGGSEVPSLAAFRGSAAVPLAAILMWPAMSVASAMVSVGGYHIVAMREGGTLAMETTNLRGLAVPKEEDTLAATLAAIDLPYQLLSSPLQHPPREQLSERTYVETLIEAASLFADSDPVKVFVVDQVNPVPFMLGYPPPRGGNLWLWPDMPPRPADEVFGDVDVVLIPKHSTYSRATLTALLVYRDYLKETFPVHEQSPRWTILKRDRAASTAAESRER